MKQPKSIFEPTVREDQSDPMYTLVRKESSFSVERGILDSMWLRFRDIADRHFHDQLQRDFHSRMWEMRLGFLLLQLGCLVQSSDHGPDLTVEVSEGRLHFEAVAPGPGTGALQIRRPQPGFSGISDTKYQLRYTQAICEKHRQHGDHVAAGRVTTTEPFVVALSAAKIPDAEAEDPECPRILKPLFAMGAPSLSVEVGTGRQTRAGYRAVPAQKKPSGAEVSTDLFRTRELSSVSAVVFTAEPVLRWAELRGGRRGADIVTVHNPFAESRLREGFLPFGREYAVRSSAIYRINDWRTGCNDRWPRRLTNPPETGACG